MVAIMLLIFNDSKSNISLNLELINKDEQNVQERDRNHHKNKEGFGTAKIDKTSSNPDAIRGREQQMIGKNGGAKSQGGTSGNTINGVSPTNPKIDQYLEEATKQFGLP